MSKRRNANGQMRREDYEAQERADDDPRAFNPELQAGTFQRASAEKLKTRRIVKARRPAQMAPVAEAPTSSNPFANVSLAAPASTNPFANVTLAAPPAAAQPQWTGLFSCGTNDSSGKIFSGYLLKYLLSGFGGKKRKRTHLGFLSFRKPNAS